MLKNPLWFDQNNYYAHAPSSSTFCKETFFQHYGTIYGHESMKFFEMGTIFAKLLQEHSCICHITHGDDFPKCDMTYTQLCSCKSFAKMSPSRKTAFFHVHVLYDNAEKMSFLQKLNCFKNQMGLLIAKVS